MMNVFLWDDLYVGMEKDFSVVVDEQKVDAFKEITGDDNPLHTDVRYAESKGFGGRVVYGMLTASFISTLGGVYLPRKNCLIQSVEVKFLKPVIVGEHININGVITELNDTVRQAVIRIRVFNDRNDKVLKGILKVGVLDE